jgi:hypothetical protein
VLGPKLKTTAYWNWWPSMGQQNGPWLLSIYQVASGSNAEKGKPLWKPVHPNLLIQTVICIVELLNMRFFGALFGNQYFSCTRLCNSQLPLWVLYSSSLGLLNRWHNHLNPNIKREAWTEQEDLMLIHAHQLYGNKWAEIAKFLPGR